jgi:hypothetical protein
MANSFVVTGECTDRKAEFYRFIPPTGNDARGRGAIKSGEESSVRKEVAKAREEERSGKSL